MAVGLPDLQPARSRFALLVLRARPGLLRRRHGPRRYTGHHRHHGIAVTAKQGVASAWNDTARELGSALGIAILGSLLNQGYRDGMADAVAALPAASGSACWAPSHSPPRRSLHSSVRSASDWSTRARVAFVGGVGDALLVGPSSSIVAVGVAVLAPRFSGGLASKHPAAAGRAWPASPGSATGGQRRCVARDVSSKDQSGWMPPR